MTEREDDVNKSSPKPPTDLEWEQEKTKCRVRQFINILEQLPRLCSPTICGTLSQPTTKSERAAKGADIFEWSMEQKAILSPANITTEMDGSEDWQNAAELNLAWRQQESERFFSQRTIAPSPIVTPRIESVRRSVAPSFQDDLMYEEDGEDGHDNEEVDDDNLQAQDLTLNKSVDNNQSSRLRSYEFQDDPCRSDTNFDLGSENNDDRNNDGHRDEVDQDECMDNLFFSPLPLKSSQTQQNMDVFSPGTFVRVMEDENTLQSTPKTTGSQLQRIRTRTTTRTDVLD